VTPPAPGRLGVWRKSVYAAGDFTLSGSLASLSLLYATYFLTQEAALRPVLAGLVPMIGRAVDAFADPLMGRLSDATTWRSRTARASPHSGSMRHSAAPARASPTTPPCT